MFATHLIKPLVLAILLTLATAANSYAQKMTAAEVLAKHLDSLGTKEKRSEIKNRLISGVSKFSLLRTTSSTSGTAVLASEDNKIYFGTQFPSTNYPFEKISFDGKNVKTAFVNPGSYTPLANFIRSHKVLFSEGLFSGALSTSWSLLNFEARKAKVGFAGKKKIDGREVYVLDYTPKGGSDLSIKLFFDAQTFQHVRSEYRQTFSAAQGMRPETSSREGEARHLLVEEFSDFKNEAGLTLPHKYRLYLLLAEQRSTTESEWTQEFSQFMFNQNLAANSFDLEGN